jgi:capsular exopolysaccharide synthesis family protein
LGRIDEALKRAGVQGEVQPSAGSGQLVTPAWSISEEPDAAPAAPAEALAPSSRPDVGLVGFSSRWKERLAAGPDSDVGLTEQYRRLAATLHHAHHANGLRSLMLTSASPGDGKTLTAVNLSLVLASSYRYKVLLIDADLRRPSIPNVGDLADGCGLSDALIAHSERKLALISITPRLTLLPAGPPIANSIEALTSPRMRQILDEASSRFDWVILDAPPVGPATDARLLSQMVGTSLFVIHAGQTQCPDVQKAIEAIGRDQILGIVLNGVEHLGSEAYYYGVTTP